MTSKASIIKDQRVIIANQTARYIDMLAQLQLQSAVIEDKNKQIAALSDRIAILERNLRLASVPITNQENLFIPNT